MSETVIFEIILHAGNAKAEAYDALRAAREGDFAAAGEHLAHAQDELDAAHKVQADIIQREAGGDKTEVTLLMVHAQDHLMTAITEKSLIENMVEMQRTISDLSRRLGEKS